jgi:PIN domain nuclease of toxin-antitoxin system
VLLLDTHTWIWAISAEKQLSAKAKKLIKKTPANQRAIASISIWEFAMLCSRGSIHVKVTPEQWLDNAVHKTGIQVFDLSAQVALESCNLPGKFHKDPADRIIVATARIHNMNLVTKDQKIIDYPHVESVW